MQHRSALSTFTHDMTRILLNSVHTFTQYPKLTLWMLHIMFNKVRGCSTPAGGCLGQLCFLW